MKKEIYILLGLGLLNLVLFIGIFKLMQQERVYHHTLGLISENYERTEGWDNYTIQKVAKPYTEWTNENLHKWDAAIYECISRRWYKVEEACFGNVRGAFFPLFPFVWKITNSSAIGISILNYLIFIFSIAMLVLHLMRGSFREKAIIYMVLITLPTTVIYIIPYTESLFLLTMTIAAIGILKNKYWLSFFGFLLMAMVRPATVFVLIAILFVEFIALLRGGEFRPFIQRSFSKSIPFLLGYAASFLIQTISSGSLMTMIDAQAHWSGENPHIPGIVDWSIEGFGMNSFAIFFVSIPAVAFLVYMIINSRKKKRFLMNTSEFTPEAYLFFVSIAYLVGIFVFSLLTSGGNLHSYFRFTLASPLFYIAIIILLNKLDLSKLRNSLVVLTVLSGSLFLFLYFTDYGGSRFQFSFAGMYLLVLTFIYLFTRKGLSLNIDKVMLPIVVLMSVVWNTYLLNMLLSNGWIFT